MNRNTLMKLLIWLDLDTIAKLYDTEGENSDGNIILINKSRYSYVKALTEVVPLGIMQSVYL